MFENIPKELMAYRSWVVWRYEDRGGPKPTKVPYNAISNFQASSTDPATWSSFEQALLAAGSYDGIGFVLSDADPFFFLDLDDTKGDEVEMERHRKIVAHFDTYAELSPSGKGVHIIGIGKVPTGTKRQYVELYSSARYMTMTGNIVTNKPIQPVNGVLTQLYTELNEDNADVSNVKSKPQVVEDHVVIERALAAKNGNIFRELLKGNIAGYPSHSEADQAMVNILQFYTKNFQQIARIFRDSGLMREKAKRDKYLFDTIKRAFDWDVSFDHIDTSQLIANGAETLRVMQDAEREYAAMLDAKFEADVAAALPQAAEAVPQGSPLAFAPVLAAGEDFALPPGLMGELAQYIYAQSPYPHPRMALAAAISLMAGICGRAWNIEGTGVNMYTLLMAATGAGKEAMASGIGKVIAATSATVPSIRDYFGVDAIASGQALKKELRGRKNFLSVQGEFGIELENMTSKHANPALKMLKSAYLDLFGKSGAGQSLGASVFADNDKNQAAIKAPGFSLLGESVAHRIYENLDEGLAIDGFLARFLIIEIDKPGMAFNDNAAWIYPEARMIGDIASIAAQALMMNSSDSHTEVMIASSCIAYDRAYRETCRAQTINAGNEASSQLWNRAHIKARRLAALVAIGVNYIEPVVTFEILQWAIGVVNDGCNRIVTKFEKNEVGDGDARMIADMKEILKRYIQEPERYTKGKLFNPAYHKAHTIGHSMLSANLLAKSSFKHAHPNALAGYQRCVKHFIDAGYLAEVSPKVFGEIFSTAKLYKIVNFTIL